jgi:signal transduction histidine kinase
METLNTVGIPKILVVDDEPDVEGMVRLRFRRQIKNGEYDFYFARNGYEALEQLKANPNIDLVVTDINMPEMDGLTLLKKLFGHNPHLRTVVISAYGNMENIRTAMNRGAYDFLMKPLNFEDFEYTLRKTLTLVKEAKAARSAEQEARRREKQANEQMRQALDKEKELNELKNRFIAMISHEYRTPLTVIQTSTDVLRRGISQLSDDPYKKFVDNITGSVRSMTDLLDDVLTATGFQESANTPKFTYLNLKNVSRSLITEMEINNRREQTILYSSSDGLENILSDENLMIYIFRNLISNAMKYSPKGSLIEFDQEISGDWIVSRVTDQGSGIDEKEIKYLFDPFHRGKNAETIGGAGLGLTIARECARKLGGDISVESEINRGTTFTVRLPIVSKKDVFSNDIQEKV